MTLCYGKTVFRHLYTVNLYENIVTSVIIYAFIDSEVKLNIPRIVNILPLSLLCIIYNTDIWRY
nr:MAG TPA: hypothetical protein [Caudoviricetes sp.]